jgi:hypothetical protein
MGNRQVVWTPAVLALFKKPSKLAEFDALRAGISQALPQSARLT